MLMNTKSSRSEKKNQKIPKATIKSQNSFSKKSNFPNMHNSPVNNNRKVLNKGNIEKSTNRNLLKESEKENLKILNNIDKIGQLSPTIPSKKPKQHVLLIQNNPDKFSKARNGLNRLSNPSPNGNVKIKTLINFKDNIDKSTTLQKNLQRITPKKLSKSYEKLDGNQPDIHNVKISKHGHFILDNNNNNHNRINIQNEGPFFSKERKASYDGLSSNYHFYDHNHINLNCTMSNYNDENEFSDYGSTIKGKLINDTQPTMFSKINTTDFIGPYHHYRYNTSSLYPISTAHHDLKRNSNQSYETIDKRGQNYTGRKNVNSCDITRLWDYQDSIPYDIKNTKRNSRMKTSGNSCCCNFVNEEEEEEEETEKVRKSDMISIPNFLQIYTTKSPYISRNSSIDFSNATANMKIAENRVINHGNTGHCSSINGDIANSYNSMRNTSKFTFNCRQSSDYSTEYETIKINDNEQKLKNVLNLMEKIRTTSPHKFIYNNDIIAKGEFKEPSLEQTLSNHIDQHYYDWQQYHECQKLEQHHECQQQQQIQSEQNFLIDDSYGLDFQSINGDIEEKVLENIIKKMKNKIEKLMVKTELNNKEIMELQKIEQYEKYNLLNLQEKYNMLIAEVYKENVGISTPNIHLYEHQDSISKDKIVDDNKDHQDKSTNARIDEIIARIEDLELKVCNEEKKKNHCHLMIEFIKSMNEQHKLNEKNRLIEQHKLDEQHRFDLHYKLYDQCRLHGHHELDEQHRLNEQFKLNDNINNRINKFQTIGTQTSIARHDSFSISSLNSISSINQQSKFPRIRGLKNCSVSFDESTNLTQFRKKENTLLTNCVYYHAIFIK